MSIQEMLKTHPKPMTIDTQVLAECVDACFECAATCTACADACLAEEMVAELRACIRTDLDCADVCNATGRIMARQTEPDTTLLRAQLEACAAACGVCGSSCEEHKDMHEHCRVCAEACRRCEASCRKVISALS